MPENDPMGYTEATDADVEAKMAEVDADCTRTSNGRGRAGPYGSKAAVTKARQCVRQNGC